ncbi:conserved hypothetical protein [Culex quinquefasciatus]|uniref:Actin maturation protease n=1 Tax=Culex quinquefasciatus TaxID=7176 RepID=B0X2P4_CULQU|nr:conserved hypothetical protein [Culex quinquefasciatus]|eukprot:XP_001863916.1 conserved hypothetical protein [Culex quinquefasciatus]
MSNNPPPPPPPASAPSTTITTSTTQRSSLVELKCDLASNNNNPNLIQLTFNTSGECTWATQYPEIQKACYLRRICQFAPPKELRVQNVTPILQTGPTCGLTALSIFFEGSPSVKTFLDMARARGYTNNGEMFSARQLNDLLAQGLENNRHLCEYKTVSHTVIDEGWLDDSSTRKQLRNGSIFYYVFARHGKTKNLALWSLRDLAHSNANLFEFCQPISHADEVFVLPEGGIAGSNGLRSQFIMIEHYRARDEIVF